MTTCTALYNTITGLGMDIASRLSITLQSSFTPARYAAEPNSGMLVMWYMAFSRVAIADINQASHVRIRRCTQTHHVRKPADCRRWDSLLGGMRGRGG